jgi:hypothetical protein
MYVCMNVCMYVCVADHVANTNAVLRQRGPGEAGISSLQRAYLPSTIRPRDQHQHPCTALCNTGIQAYRHTGIQAHLCSYLHLPRLFASGCTNLCGCERTGPVRVYIPGIQPVASHLQDYLPTCVDKHIGTRLAFDSGWFLKPWRNFIRFMLAVGWLILQVYMCKLLLLGVKATG